MDRRLLVINSLLPRMSASLPESPSGEHPLSQRILCSPSAHWWRRAFDRRSAELRATHGDICTVMYFEDTIGLASFGNAPMSVRVVKAGRI
jgi:hypothetical protein